MPRLNIETNFWSDPRFQDLMIQVGDRFKAVGLVVCLWNLAQQFWCPEMKLIPLEVWDQSNLPDHLFQVGLAERRQDGIYAKGIEKHFAWYFDAKERGKRSVEARRLKYGSAQPQKQLETKSKCSRKHIETSRTEVERLRTSSSSSFSKRKRIVDSTESTQLWNYYEEKIKEKGITPIHEGAKTNVLCKKVVTTYGLDKAKAMVDVFLTDNSPFVRDKSWPIGLLISQQQNYFNKLNSKTQPLDFGGDY